ncbi:MAG: gas vesicle protein [Desulfobacterales bacterium]|nr:gas vesicle protein [Desulfobacterales bacterium]
MLKFDAADTEDVSLCELLDRVLNKGAVISGELTISVANVDLIYLGLQVILTSIETGKRVLAPSMLDRPPSG